MRYACSLGRFGTGAGKQGALAFYGVFMGICIGVYLRELFLESRDRLL